MDLAEIAERAVDGAQAAGADDAEAFAQDSIGREIRVFEGQVESLSEAGAHGLGIRAWVGNRAGYAYGTDLSDEGIVEIALGALETARLSDSDEHAAAPEAAGEAEPIKGLSDPKLSQTSTEKKVELAKEVEAGARETDKRVVGVETAVYVDEEERVALVSSTGVRAEFEATSCYAFAQAIAEEDGSRQTGLGFGIARSPAQLNANDIGREAAVRAVMLLGAKKPESRTCAVVLDATVAASFAGFVGSTLCADAVQRGRSPFAGRLGDPIGSEVLTLIDDGRAPGGLASAPIDAEGRPRAAVALIEDGKLGAYLHDTYTARRAGEESTANASRAGYRSPPSVSTSNLVVRKGEKDLAELITEAGEGMLVTDVAGLHSGVNPVTGQFSVGATGIVIRDGELAEAANEFTIASDLVSMLSAIQAAGSDARWVPFGGSVCTPSLLVAGMAVGGT